MSVEAVRRRIAQQARHRCGYCQTQERVSGIPLTLEHIIPRVAGGGDEEKNLWVSYRLRNELKGVQTEAIDPQTGKTAQLYNQRTQNWTQHYAWSDDGTEIIGLTDVGRATVGCPVAQHGVSRSFKGYLGGSWTASAKLIIYD
jgi:hypothetical protein